MGVRSCGWIMESTEGRWPSLDPTKNSLWTEKLAVSFIQAAQAGWAVEGARVQALGSQTGASWCPWLTHWQRGNSGALLTFSPPPRRRGAQRTHKRV